MGVFLFPNSTPSGGAGGLTKIVSVSFNFSLPTFIPFFAWRKK
nr:hypothetical protein [Terrilactibacillus laevilacticus]